MALDSSEVDLTALVGRLYSDMDSAVAAMVSMALTVVVDGDCFEVSMSNGSSCDHVPLSSLRLTLSDARNTDTGQFLLIRSGEAGGLANFAADAGRLLGLTGDSVVLDRHLGQADESGLPEPSARDLEASSEVNRAIGVLIAGGRSAAEGRAELHRLTAQLGQSTSEVARRTLRDARGWFPPRGP